MSRTDRIRKLIRTHVRRLQKLEEKKALKGTNAEPELLIEIEDLEAQIKKLQLELGEIIAGISLLPLDNTSAETPLQARTQGSTQKFDYGTTIIEIKTEGDPSSLTPTQKSNLLLSLAIALECTPDLLRNID